MFVFTSLLLQSPIRMLCDDVILGESRSMTNYHKLLSFLFNIITMDASYICSYIHTRKASSQIVSYMAMQIINTPGNLHINIQICMYNFIFKRGILLL